MPSLDEQTLSAFVTRSGLPIQTFVETGTYLGDTAILASKMFKTVHTIEINDVLYNEQQRNLRKFSNIRAHHGDSVKVLPKVLEEETESMKNGHIMFWLDAHWSMGNTSFGQEHVPLYKELHAIVQHVTKTNGACLVAIDDVRLFGKMDHEVDWTPICTVSIMEKVQGVLKDSWFESSQIDEKDRLLLVLENKSEGGLSVRMA
jgi:hypothetical protein